MTDHEAQQFINKHLFTSQDGERVLSVYHVNRLIDLMKPENANRAQQVAIENKMREREAVLIAKSKETKSLFSIQGFRKNSVEHLNNSTKSIQDDDLIFDVQETGRTKSLFIWKWKDFKEILRNAKIGVEYDVKGENGLFKNINLSGKRNTQLFYNYIKLLRDAEYIECNRSKLTVIKELPIELLTTDLLREKVNKKFPKMSINIIDEFNDSTEIKTIEDYTDEHKDMLKKNYIINRHKSDGEIAYEKEILVKPIDTSDEPTN